MPRANFEGTPPKRAILFQKTENSKQIAKNHGFCDMPKVVFDHMRISIALFAIIGYLIGYQNAGFTALIF